MKKINQLKMFANLKSEKKKLLLEEKKIFHIDYVNFAVNMGFQKRLLRILILEVFLRFTREIVAS